MKKILARGSHITHAINPEIPRHRCCKAAYFRWRPSSEMRLKVGRISSCSGSMTAASLLSWNCHGSELGRNRTNLGFNFLEKWNRLFMSHRCELCAYICDRFTVGFFQTWMQCSQKWNWDDYKMDQIEKYFAHILKCQKGKNGRV